MSTKSGPAHTLWLLAAFTLLTAPFLRVSNQLLMQSRLRRYASFGFAHFALVMSSRLRHHLLKRYIRNLAGESGFDQWLTRLVLPSAGFQPEAFCEQIRRQRALLLVGPSGVGKTSYLQYLAARCCFRDGWFGSHSYPVPVYLPLGRLRGQSPEGLVSSQLALYGEITDRELVDGFMQQGGFLILIDGLNEIDEAARQEVAAFVERYHRANFFCLSTQFVYAGFEGLARLDMTPLTPDKVNELLRQRLGEEETDTLIAGLTGHDYSVLSLPLNAEFAIEVTEQGRPLPGSEAELYDAALSPVLDRWIRGGQTAYPGLLYERAYDMVRSREVLLPAAGANLPEAMRDALLERKLLIRSGSQLQFRHELIRSWLASQYLLPRWRTRLAEPGIHLGDHWLVTLEFLALQQSNAADVGDLLFMVLGKDAALAGELFTHIRDRVLGLTSGWVEDFHRAYGAAMLTAHPDQSRQTADSE